MKTALQELLSWAKHPIEEGEVNHSLYSKINELMEKERQQIIDAFVAGNFEGYKGAKGQPFILVNDYINKKYTENESNI